MIRSTLLALVVRMAAAITDSSGYHFHAPSIVLEAITDGVLADPLFSGDAGAELTAAVVVVFAAQESGFAISPRGPNDGGRACGLMQKHAAGETCLRLRRDPAYAVRLGLVDLRRSMLLNPDHPWAAYAGSPTSPAAIRISDARSAEARSLLVTP